MSRVRKWRVWDVIARQMHYLTTHTDTIPLSALDHRSPNRIVMDFTGLQDADGEDIYEGDLVGLIGPDGEFPWSPYKVVEFRDGAFGYEKYELFTPYASMGRDWPAGNISALASSRVAGNIYEHPHLLETDDERQSE